MKATTYTVRGEGTFPAALLDHDGAWPRSGEDRQRITGETRRRVVRLATIEPMAPDLDAWLRAGWAVEVAR